MSESVQAEYIIGFKADLSVVLKKYDVDTYTKTDIHKLTSFLINVIEELEDLNTK